MKWYRTFWSFCFSVSSSLSNDFFNSSTIFSFPFFKFSSAILLFQYTAVHIIISSLWLLLHAILTFFLSFIFSTSLFFIFSFSLHPLPLLFPSFSPPLFFIFSTSFVYFLLSFSFSLPKLSLFNCTTPSRWPRHEIVSVILHKITCKKTIILILLFCRGSS